MAQTNITIVINSAPSTSITFTPAATFTAPVPAGTLIGTLAVLPAGWSGTIALSGTDAAKFTLNGLQLAAAVILNAGTLHVTATATP